MKKTIKMVACDLDGTLFTDSKRVSDRTQLALRRCAELGTKVVFATGRGNNARFQVPFELFDGHVVNNGASAYAGEKKIYNRLMLAEQVRPLLLVCEERGLKAAVQLGDMHYANFDLKKEWPEIKEFEVVEFYLHDFDSEKIVTETTDNGDIAAISEKIPGGLYFTMTRDRFVMIMHKEATKSNGVKALAELWGIAQSDVVAFGDDMNDLDLLKYAGIGVAMGNAVSDARAVADEVCGSNNDDGIAKWLEENVLP